MWWETFRILDQCILWVSPLERIETVFIPFSACTWPSLFSLCLCINIQIRYKEKHMKNLGKVFILNLNSRLYTSSWHYWFPPDNPDKAFIGIHWLKPKFLLCLQVCGSLVLNLEDLKTNASVWIPLLPPSADGASGGA